MNNMTTRKGMISNSEKAKQKIENSGKKAFVMPKKFETTGEVLTIRIISSNELSWYKNLIGKEIQVVQNDFDSFFAIDYQDETKPYIRYIVLMSDCEIINN